MNYTNEQKMPEETVQAELVVEEAELSEEQLEAVSGGAKIGIGGGCFPINFPDETVTTLPEMPICTTHNL